jgi:hypothetical protein
MKSEVAHENRLVKPTPQLRLRLIWFEAHNLVPQQSYRRVPPKSIVPAACSLFRTRSKEGLLRI